MKDVTERHGKAGAGLAQVVAAAAAKNTWHAPSPCTEWDARGVVEHVIGFQDTLLASQLGAHPQRPRDDPQPRRPATEKPIRAAPRADPTLAKTAAAPGRSQPPA